VIRRPSQVAGLGRELDFEVDAQIAEGWILGMDSIELLGSAPIFDLFFAADCRADVGEGFEVDEAGCVVCRGEARDRLGPVLGDSAFEDVGHARVESSCAAG